MPNYDFRSLSPHDFEELVRDLLQAEENIHLESFGPGKDKGIDFRRAEGTNGLIVQAKHYARSGVDALLNSLKNEKPKVAKLSPSRYVIGTSVSMSPDRKRKIQEALKPHVNTPGDIFGAEDLNNLLNKHPKVEEQHFKLWIASSTVLKRILNNATYVRTEQEVERIKKDARLFVPNAGLPDALKLLEEGGLLIISGQPGVGKTTLARIIALFHLDRKWELIVVEDFEEALKIFNGTRKQLFFFDDFLGQIRLTLDVIRRVEPRLLEFIERTKGSTNTRFVLTTREYILKQAQIESERLNNPEVDLRKHIVDLASYTRPIRSKILYNHIYFSDISSEKKQAFLKDQFYINVIDHPNFNPRMIEQLTSPVYSHDIVANEYASWVSETLDHPERLWDHAFRKHLSPAAKNLILTLFFCGADVDLTRLLTAFRTLHTASSKLHRHPTSADDFKQAIKETEGSFIEVDHEEIDFVNPSVRDYLDHALLEMDALELTLKNMIYPEQALAAWEFIQTHDTNINLSSTEISRLLEISSELLWKQPAYIRVRKQKFTSTVQVGLPLPPRLKLVFEWWRNFESDKFATAAIRISERMTTEPAGETEIEDLRHLLKIAGSSEFSNFPDVQNLIENLKRRMFDIAFDEFRLSTDEIMMARHFIEKNPELSPENAFDLVVKQIQNTIDEITYDLSDLSSSSEVETYESNLHDLADWAGISLWSVEDDIENRRMELEQQEHDYEHDTFGGRGIPSKDETDSSSIISLFSTLLHS